MRIPGIVNAGDEPIFGGERFSFAFFKEGDVPMRKIVILAAAAVSLFVAACNTVEGAGKDVSAAGNAVTTTARDAK